MKLSRFISRREGHGSTPPTCILYGLIMIFGINPPAADGLTCDYDADADVDQSDFAVLQRCMSGAGVAQTNIDCVGADLDGDGDVDPADLDHFRSCFSGPAVAADPTCLDGIAPEQCFASAASWQNFSFDPQVMRFTVAYAAEPGGQGIDGLVTLSSGAGVAYNDYAVLVRFSVNNVIDVRNGSIFAADQVVPYVAGQRYDIKVTVDVGAHTYDVAVTPPDGNEVVLASGYAFRTEQLGVSQLDHWGVQAQFGSLEVCGLTVQPDLPEAGVLAVSPAVEMTCGGQVGGPYSPQSHTYTLRNVGTTLIKWNCTSEFNWLTLPTSYGFLAPGASTEVVATINTSAEGLSVGEHINRIDFQNVTNGDGNTSRSIRLTVLSEAGGDPITPIARWDVVPGQRLDSSEVLEVGVVAFSKNGIAQVAFSANGQPIGSVSQMSRNPRTGVWEYWIPVAADQFSGDGVVNLTATVTGGSGGTRVLEPLRLIVNPNGTIPAPEAWVAPGGSDATGLVNVEALPFGTVGGAMAAIREWMSIQGHGAKVDGGIIRLLPGTHAIGNGGIWTEIATVDEWVTVTTVPGGNASNTIIANPAGTIQTKWLKLEGVTLQSPGQYGYLFKRPSEVSDAHLWVDKCVVIGSGRHVGGSHPVEPQFPNKWFTDSSIRDTDFGVQAGRFARGLQIEHIGNDVFVHTPFIVNCVANDIDPGSTGWHSDGWQWYHEDGPVNTIAYNYQVTDMHYQGIMCRTGVSSAADGAGVAFVNTLMELRSPIRAPGGSSLWMRGVDHFLLWHCTFLGHSFSIYDDKEGSSYFAANVTNLSVRGSLFAEFKETKPHGTTDFSDFLNNHYIAPAGYGGDFRIKAPGVGVTSGDPKIDGGGRPMPGSVLLDRVSPVGVPTDVQGLMRSNPATIGPYEP